MKRAQKRRLVADRARARNCAPHPESLGAEMEQLLAPMALAGSPIAPSAELWRRIEASITVETEALSHRYIEANIEAQWVAIEPGIEIRRLWNNATHLLRCQPGTVLASHLHSSEEHLIVLSGDLVIGGRTFLAGDHICSPPGMDSIPHHTIRGCVLLCQMAA